MPNHLYRLTADQVASGIKNRDFSAQEYISQILERIEKIDVNINAFVAVDKQVRQKKHVLSIKEFMTENRLVDLQALHLVLKTIYAPRA